MVDLSQLTRGFHPPEECARGEKNCQSLAQVIATDDVPQPSFICCGEILNNATPRPQDQLSFCHRGDATSEVDYRIFLDRRDASHFIGVLGMALATVMPLDDLHGVEHDEEIET